ncbi:MarR family winged helix-turn-helix transcriptional regulator [Pseudoramibacter sp.]|jgi:DNA-binding MarR family transcriptional regulator|uniref:MarR family winged helix-turn-helix transcriptional regulator n=1 Tax=Pseudoramibacter sp. TaxID=2034862 RepID=UPI0025FE8441|nr:MarR family transcriptional regulator [Pseudoramibacter sp.]MCH4071631.1 MarR family transcriptional regulator [Pseudoramibacter sp.]MCH4105399.1 MarR family transcriptional regulator [Pseudoramibacter sp.]
MDLLDESFSAEFVKVVLMLHKGSIHQYLKEMAKKMDLRYGELVVLLQVLRKNSSGFKPMTVSGLSRVNHCTKSNMSQIVRALEEKNYLRRVQSREDRRTVFLELTDRAGEMMRKNHLFYHTPLDAAAARLGREKADELISLLWELCRLSEEVQAENQDGDEKA